MALRCIGEELVHFDQLLFASEDDALPSYGPAYMQFHSSATTEGDSVYVGRLLLAISTEESANVMHTTSVVMNITPLLMVFICLGRSLNIKLIPRTVGFVVHRNIPHALHPLRGHICGGFQNIEDSIAPALGGKPFAARFASGKGKYVCPERPATEHNDAVGIPNNASLTGAARHAKPLAD